MPSVTELSPATSLEARISDLREELFAIVEAVSATAPPGLTSVHVSLQAASNELGKAERALREA